MDHATLTPIQDDRQFEIIVRRLADDLRFGQDASPYVGSGVDYVQSRPFIDGDSVRDIDWLVTARTGRFHVKQFEPPKTTPIYLVVDTSASMSFSSQPASKFDWAVLLAGGLAMASMRRMSPVGLLAGGELPLHFDPSLSRPKMLAWLHALRWRRFDEQTLLSVRLDQLCGILHSRSLVVVLSDLHHPAIVPAIKRLVQRHDCIALHLEDPAERGRLRGGIVHGREAETGRSFVAHGWSRWFHRSRPRPADQLAAAGVDYLLLPTDGPVVFSLQRFLLQRGGLMRNTR